ncbi:MULTISPECIES: CopG family antitoxin [unclassified Rickettsia]|uniref:CopG family antitoxin n=1 Tax=unclassified Rickettsia TaxID=114295 RepID=UPI00209E2A3E|nr:CopG family antitoxin [Rickettsia endosymbiont of Ceutorhynchus assimilis]
MKKYKLSEEEKGILDYFENNKLLHLSEDELKRQKNIAKVAAVNFSKKTARINIRLPGHDLNHIKRIAAQEGMPYQTLISSVLHKYASGYLKFDKAN